MAKKLSKSQQDLLEHLRSGKYLISALSGWYDLRRKGSGELIRVETQDALAATGELVEVELPGKRRPAFRIYHRDHVPEEAVDVKAQG